jgi:hypothetical protein
MRNLEQRTHLVAWIPFDRTTKALLTKPSHAYSIELTTIETTFKS